MAQYTIDLNYKASIRVVVEADNEGVALDKARNVAEEADANEFYIGSEEEAHVINVS